MDEVVFDDKAKKPSPADLRETLGRSYTHWQAIISRMSADYKPLSVEWSFFSPKWGWGCRLKHKKRTILYLTPRRKHFTVGFILGEKAVAAARDSTLPASILTLIEEAPKYPEGRGLRIELRNAKTRDAVFKLAAIKMAN